jgi:hypothetical protein
MSVGTTWIGRVLVLTAEESDEPAAVSAGLTEAVASIGVLRGSVPPDDAAVLFGADIVYAVPGAVLAGGVATPPGLAEHLDVIAAPHAGVASWPSHEPVAATLLLAAGLVARVFDDAVEEALALAGRLADQSPLALRLTLEITRRPGSLREVLAWEAAAQTECLASPEHAAVLARGVI